jgi:hypothetical protein
VPNAFRKEVKRMDQWKKVPYAMLGTGDLAIQKATELYGRASSLGRKARRTEANQVYDGLAGRGEALAKRLQRSKTAKRAVDGSKQASRQLKGAMTSIRKAVGLEEQKKSSTRKAS